MAKAAAAGFDLVEIHDDWAEPGLAQALERHGLGLVSLNTAHHGAAFGRASEPGAAETVRSDLEAACRAGKALGASAIHVLAGKGQGAAADAAFDAALRHGLEVWPGTILIEPFCAEAVAGYHLGSLDAALAVIERVGHPRLKLMFDTYHIGMSEPDLGEAFARVRAHVGHVQIASVPGRSEPDTGRIDILAFLESARDLGYDEAVGVEFRPAGEAPRLDWLDRWRDRLGA